MSLQVATKPHFHTKSCTEACDNGGKVYISTTQPLLLLWGFPVCFASTCYFKKESVTVFLKWKAIQMFVY